MLRNGNGMELHVLRTGAAVQRLLVPDAAGSLADVVLGFDNETAYEASEHALLHLPQGATACWCSEKSCNKKQSSFIELPSPCSG